MMTIYLYSRLCRKQHTRGWSCPIATSICIVTLTLMTGVSKAQETPLAQPAIAPSQAASQAPQEPASQDGYRVHETADLGGHLVQVSGSSAMYATLVNLQSGPRVLGQTFEMHAVPGTKHVLFDNLSASSAGFGGDPYDYARLSFRKGKLYEFSGAFRRDRQYFDYDLLSNPLIPAGIVSPVGTPTSTTLYTFPQVNYSPVLYNTVRRMTDTNLTILPLAKVTYRFGYSQSIFQGPSYSSIHLAGDGLLVQNLRNSDDNFLAAVDWKPFQHTQITFEELITHYKEDTSYTLAPIAQNLQLSTGTPVTLGYDNTVRPTCSDGGQPVQIAGGTTATPTPTGGSGIALPTVDPTCTGYIAFTRFQPTRAIFPTEVLHLQSASIRRIEVNGDLRYTVANSNLANFNESFNGITGATRFEQVTGNAHTRRIDVGADFGILWQATKKISLSEQYDFAAYRQPGYASIATQTFVTAKTPPSSESMLNNVVTTTGIGPPTVGNTFLGQKIDTNNVTVRWDATLRATLSLTYRYRSRAIATTNVSGNINATTGNVFVNIHEKGGILNLAMRPTSQLRVNAAVEALYDDNAFTAFSPRETQHYKLHAVYRPKPWATISGAFNDLERRNNQNDGIFTGNPSLAGTGTSFTGTSLALNHVDYSRIFSFSTSLTPNEYYGIDFDYAYTDVYTSTNICFNTGQVASAHGAPMYPAVVTNLPCPINVGVSNNLGGTSVNPDDQIKDFMDAPSQLVLIGLTVTPVKALRTSVGYRISSVSGSQTFLNPGNVNGSLQSAYQSPYVNLAWTVRPRWIWKADYNFYEYGEGGPSGPSLCQVTAGAAFTSCPLNAPSGPTAARNFHGNIVTLGMHYEF